MRGTSFCSKHKDHWSTSQRSIRERVWAAGRGIDLQQVNDEASLAALPVLRKSDLMAAQQACPPFGGFVDLSLLAGCRLFTSPGPVWEPQLPGGDPWQAARALHAAGLRSGHRVHNAFSYHMTPGGFILDEGARALGCIVFPAGVGQTDQQTLALQHLQPDVYVGTPDFLQVLLDKAQENGSVPASLQRAMVSGGALFPAMRERYKEQGIHVQQCYATADLGVIAYESASGDTVHPGMIVNEGLIVEIVIPGTGIPVAPGAVGEIVVTRMDPAYPLIRFATGDLSAFIEEPSPCGRTNRRIKGWMGRADQRAKVRGMFIDPVQLKDLPNHHPEIRQWRLLINREQDADAMQLSVVCADGVKTNDAWLDAVAATLRQLTTLGGTVRQVDTLPDDGVIIEDQRDYDQNG